jgi:WD40 repeat protein
VYIRIVNNNIPVVASSQGYCVTFSPDGIYLAFCFSSSPTLTIYLRDGDAFGALPPAFQSNSACATAFSPDGNCLAVSSSSYPSFAAIGSLTATQLNIRFTKTTSQYSGGLASWQVIEFN